MPTFVIHALVSAIVLSSRIIVPVEGEVIRRFESPACPYCAGHRGVTVETTMNSDVVAIADGEITFAGEVGGLIYVVQRIAPDVRITYGWLSSIEDLVTEGTMVEQGAPLGTTGENMYFGVRVGEMYVEPLRFLGLGRVRLYGPGRVIVSEGGEVR